MYTKSRQRNLKGPRLTICQCHYFKLLEHVSYKKKSAVIQCWNYADLTLVNESHKYSFGERIHDILFQKKKKPTISKIEASGAAF